VVVSSPSGGGKTTLVCALLREDTLVRRIVTCTTREPRPGEKNGRDYHFWSPDRFARAVKAGEMAEHARVHEHFYGVPAKPLADAIAAGKTPVLVIDVQGARSVSRIFKKDAVLVFVLPPDWQTLKKRLTGRGDTVDCELRLRTARREIAAMNRYGYIVVNDDIAKAVGAVKAIIAAERLRAPRQLLRLRAGPGGGYRFE